LQQANLLQNRDFTHLPFTHSYFSFGLVFYNRTVKTANPVGAIITGILCAWASFTFFRGGLTGAPPMYSHGWFQRWLHFIAGIIFASLAVGAVVMLTGKWHLR